MPSTLDRLLARINSRAQRKTAIPANPARLKGTRSHHPSQNPAPWAADRARWARELWPDALRSQPPKPTRQLLRRRLFQARCQEFAQRYGGEPRRVRRAMAGLRARLDYRQLGRGPAEAPPTASSAPSAPSASSAPSNNR